MRVKDAWKILQEEESAKLINEEDLKTQAVTRAEQTGIVFIDEIELQYFDDFENSKIEDKFIKYCDKIIENIESDLSLTQSHALVKYHKDVHQNGEDVLKDLFE